MKFPISSGLAGRGRYWGTLRRVGATSLRVTSGRASRPLCNWLKSKSFGEKGKNRGKSLKKKKNPQVQGYIWIIDPVSDNALSTA